MPWKTLNIMDLREEFVLLADRPDANRRELCRRFGISPQTGYKWLERFRVGGRGDLADLSRRPDSSPRQTPADVEKVVIEVRKRHPAWGGRKISRFLKDRGGTDVAPSTVTSILHRHGLIAPEASDKPTAWTRFERDTPNSLWQVDFKGHFDIPSGRCSPLTMLDDHSRFNLALRACKDNKTGTVRDEFENVFARCGLPLQMNFDNGPPWGSPKASGQLTELTVWLVRLGICVTHSRPYHPQTNGKDERFHRTLKAEVLAGRQFNDFASVQSAFDQWRRVYNHQRPHEALQLATPITRYQPSPRALPARLDPVEYPDQTEVVKVRWNGELRLRGRKYRLSSALDNQHVAVRNRADQDGILDVYFLHHRCLTIDLNQKTAP